MAANTEPAHNAETVVAQDAWSVVFEALCDSYDPYAEDGFSVTTGTEAVLDALRRAGLLIDGFGSQKTSPSPEQRPD